MTGTILSVSVHILSHVDYQERCEAVRQVLSTNTSLFIHQNSIGGGLGHKYLSLQYSLSYALILGRQYRSTVS